MKMFEQLKGVKDVNTVEQLLDTVFARATVSKQRKLELFIKAGVAEILQDR